ncbi:hypothetical protein TRAPUB_11774 [Trametes pubescens]|uniref:Uncharacterized protein n=1 Tax=Trametes pubescens TaxID=154538 RepID=A0A1M2VW03_TRAPU|nr:hypothetical protein TRAPUB_11774 [Trametes pubescens]
MKTIKGGAQRSGLEALVVVDAEHVVKGSFYRSRLPIRQATLAGGGLTGRRDPTSVNNIGPPAQVTPPSGPGSTLSRKRHAGAGGARLEWCVENGGSSGERGWERCSA